MVDLYEKIKTLGDNTPNIALEKYAVKIFRVPFYKSDPQSLSEDEALRNRVTRYNQTIR